MRLGEARRRRALARWHRRLALVVGLWLLALAVTGVFINHANDWGLDRSPLPASLQQLAYGIEPGPDFCFLAEAIGPDCRDVFAQLALPSGTLVLSPSRLYLLDASGRLVEALGVSQMGLDALAAGFADGSAIYLRDSRQTVVTDPDLLDWRTLDANSAAGLDAAAWQRRSGQPAGDLTWERLFLDVHAARFLGPAAKLTNDVLAGIIVLLGVTGGWLYLAKRRSRRR